MSKLGPFSENTIVVGDCLDIMAQMPGGCVDLVVTDPPYGVRRAKWDSDEPYNLWLPSIGRVVKDGKPILTYAANRHIHKVIMAGEDAGLSYIRTLVMWKCNSEKAVRSEAWFWNWEPIIVFRNGDNWQRCWAGMDGDVWRTLDMLDGETTGHPSTKPAHAIERAIRVSSFPGDLIFDPFIGSGTTAIVADRLGRKFFGCDISPDYVEMALARLEKDRAGRQLALL